jgi:hypothetical protein
MAAMNDSPRESRPGGPVDPRPGALSDPQAGRPLDGRLALVTGGAVRLGRSIALRLARDGCDVVVHYRSSAGPAEQTAEDLRAAGAEAWTCRADLAETEQAETLIDRCGELAGRPVDVLVNNASIFPAQALMDFTRDQLAENVQVHAFAPLTLARRLARTAAGGDIVNLLDSRIADRDAEHAAYHLSKRMLHDLTRLLAVELAPGFKVNGVAPGLILPPPGVPSEEGENYLRRLAHTNPLNRWGSPGQIADAAAFLVECDFVTGQVIYVDGGRNLRGCLYG